MVFAKPSNVAGAVVGWEGPAVRRNPASASRSYLPGPPALPVSQLTPPAAPSMLNPNTSTTREARVPLSPMEVLRKVPLFSGLGESDLAAFADLTRERSYPKGSVIVFEDDPGDALFLVAAGQVKVLLIAEDGREVILSVLGEGSFFRAPAATDEAPPSPHVIAMVASSPLVLRREDFQARLRNSPA